MGLNSKRAHLLLCVSVLLSSISLVAQNSCNVIVPFEPEIVQASRAVHNVAQTDHFLATAEWEGLDNGLIFDQDHISLLLEPYDRSNTLSLTDFNFNVPANSVIHGLRVSFIGRTEGEGKISEMQLQFTTSAGAVGIDKANQPALLGTEWAVDTLEYDRWWKYGYQSDLWGRDWTVDEINSDQFGVILQIENQTDDEIIALLNQVKITVYYTPPYNTCVHDCIVFSTESIDGIENYNWEFPSNFEMIESPVNQHILNLVAENNEQGTYQVCVTPEGQNRCCRDFIVGSCELGSIGNLVWKDSNLNGQFDNGEQGIPNVRVALYNESGMWLEDQLTNASGNYLFSNLVAGNYLIKTDQPFEDCEISIAEDISGDNNSNYYPANGETSSDYISLAEGENVTDVDFGWAPKAGSIKGYVWRDSNGDSQLSNEQGIQSIEVNLYNCEGTLVETTLTDAAGNYCFEDVDLGSYYLGIYFFASSTASIGLDSDIVGNNPTDGWITDCVDVIPGDSVFVDFGFIPFGSIGDYVFNDENRDGLQDNSDWPLQGVVVSLNDGSGAVISSTVTNADGYYLFDQLPAGTYSLTVNYPDDTFMPSILNAGSDDSIDSDGTDIGNNQVRSETINLFDGAALTNYDFGFIKRYATVTGRYVLDSNGDGVLLGEPGVPSAQVFFYDCVGPTLVTTRNVDSNGEFTFTGFMGQSYFIVFDTNVTGVQVTASPSDINNSNGPGSTECFPILDETTLNYFGVVVPTSMVGNRVWEDQNRNGIQDAGEPGIPNIDVRLFNQANDLLDMTITNADGLYTFTEIMPDPACHLEVIVPTGFVSAPVDQGTNDEVDSDGIETSGMSRSATFALSNGFSTMDMDFGFTRMGGSIAGEIWIDGNGNLSQEAEISAEGFMVQLKSCDGNMIATTPTNADGIYIFNDIAPGSYYVQVDVPSNYSHSIGGDSQTTSVIEIGATDCFTMNDQDQINLLQGIIPHSNIGDFVWNDLNKNGIQDTGEPGFADVEISLISPNNTLLQSTITSVDGLYQFTNIPAGDYTIELNIPDGFDPTQANSSSFDLDSDGIDLGTIVNSSTITLRDGVNNSDVDFGFFEEEIIVLPTASIFGMIWIDGNGNNVKDFEDGNSNVQVSLFDCNSQSIISTTTSSFDGTYLFNDLLAGEYAILVDITNNQEFSIGGDSFITNANGQGSTDCITLIDGGTAELNAGIIPLSSISGRVWVDDNSDGIEDATEIGFEGIELNLFSQAGNIVATIFSDNSGSYNFNSLRPGSYYAQLSFPDGAYGLTTSNTTTADVDSEGSVINGFIISDPMILADGNILQDRDFGLITITPEANITGNFLRDQNGDGNISTDPGIEGALISLYNCVDGSLVETTLTDNNGAYIFTSVLPGEYYIVFPEMEEFDLLEEGQSDITSILAAGATDCFSVLDDLGANLIGGAVPLSIVGDFVWEDSNEDGIQDNGEIGIAGIEIFLYDQAMSLIGQTITSTDGSYNFEDVPPGNYYAEVDVKDFEISPFDASANDEENSDLSLINGVPTSKPVLLFDGADYLDLDFGLYATEIDTSGNDTNNSITGIAFEDLDGNGINDGADVLTDGILVSLYNLNGNLEATTSTIDGAYEFTGFPDGVYYVQFDFPSETSATINGSGTDPLNDSDISNLTDLQTDNLDFQFGGSMVGVNGGFFYYAAVGNFIWFDTNEDGIQDNDEEGANNFVIRLWNEAGEPLGIQTSSINPLSDEPGFYFFDNLPPGNYYISTTINFGTSFTQPNQGNESLDSNIDGSNGPGTSELFTLTSGEQKNDIDIGLLTTPGSVGDLVWIDDNGDGIYNDGEEGINNVNIDLYTEGGNLVASTSTGDDAGGNPGYYEFTNVAVGNYYIVVEMPDNFTATEPFKGGNSSEDSDITNNIVEGSSNIFSIGSGVFSDDIDCGIFEPSSIGDYVWEDEDMDGTQEFGEFGIADAEVTLVKVGEGPVETQVTENDGRYKFEDVRPGSYYIEVTPPDGFQLTQANAGTIEAVDSDADITGLTTQFDVTQGSSTTEIDFGLVPANASILGRAWLDDGNGLQDTDESSLQFIEVRLLDASMNEVDNMLTNALGDYAFTNLPPGVYHIKFEPTPQHIFTLQDATFNDAEDSDADENGITDMLDIATGTTQIRNVDVGYVFTGGPIIQPTSFPQFQVNYFPSPARNYVNVEFTKYDNADVEIQVYDMKGNFISSRSYGNFPTGDQILNYPMEGLANGNYLMLIDLGKSRQSKVITIFN